MTPCPFNLREIKFTCYSEVSNPPWHSILRQLHGSPNLMSVHLNFSSRVVTDAKDFFVFLESLARQHPRVTDLLVWPHCVNNSPWLDLRSHVQSMCTHFTHLVHLNLSLGGLDSAGVITVLETLHLPSLRDFRLTVMQLHELNRAEEELKWHFINQGHSQLWSQILLERNSIVQRRRQQEILDATAAKNRKKEIDEAITMGLCILVAAAIFILVAWGVISMKGKF